jgi:hypothetical protein
VKKAAELAEAILGAEDEVVVQGKMCRGDAAASPAPAGAQCFAVIGNPVVKRNETTGHSAQNTALRQERERPAKSAPCGHHK